MSTAASIALLLALLLVAYAVVTELCERAAARHRGLLARGQFEAERPGPP